MNFSDPSNPQPGSTPEEKENEIPKQHWPIGRLSDDVLDPEDSQEPEHKGSTELSDDASGEWPLTSWP